jgi:hypothetical protein
MASEIELTTDHDEIRRWVESVGGRPVEVQVAGSGGQVGVPALDVPGRRTSDAAEPVSWDDWFAAFDHAGLALLYEPSPAPSAPGPYGKLVPR